jgi:hypothetical protein
MQVVPDEGDKYCVAAARNAHLETSQRGLDVAIFSDDSDLLLFDAGEKTTVIGIRALQQRQSNGTMILSSTLTSPVQVAQSLGLSNLLQLGYQLEQDPYISVTAAVQKIRNSTVKPDLDEELTDLALKSYSHFMQQYELQNQEQSIFKALQDQPLLRTRTADLDPRISEFILQTQNCSPSVEDDHLTMYLPVLLEDPARSSAWIPSK